MNNCVNWWCHMLNARERTRPRRSVPFHADISIGPKRHQLHSFTNRLATSIQPVSNFFSRRKCHAVLIRVETKQQLLLLNETIFHPMRFASFFFLLVCLLVCLFVCLLVFIVFYCYCHYYHDSIGFLFFSFLFFSFYMKRYLFKIFQMCETWARHNFINGI